MGSLEREVLIRRSTPRQNQNSSPGWPGVYMFVTLTNTKDINSVVDFDGKPYSSGPKGSSNEVVFNYIMDALNSNPKSVIFQPRMPLVPLLMTILPGSLLLGQHLQLQSSRLHIR